MADIWQWKGNATTGSGLIHFTGTETVNVSGNLTIENILKGSMSIVISANITADLTGDTTYTSAETSIVGYSSIFMETIAGTGTRTVQTSIYSTLSSGGTMVSLIDKDTSAQMTTGASADSRTVRFTGLPDYLAFATVLSAG